MPVINNLPQAGVEPAIIKKWASGAGSSTTVKTEQLVVNQVASREDFNKLDKDDTQLYVINSVGSDKQPVYIKDGQPIAANPGEAYLTWGGKSITGDVGPVDAAMIQELGANRLAMNSKVAEEMIIVEYSQDGGASWLNYPNLSSKNKAGMTNGGNGSTGLGCTIGARITANIDRSQDLLRVTFTNTYGKLYSTLKKFAVKVSTGGLSDCYCKIEGRKQANVLDGVVYWETLLSETKVEGDSGWNILNSSYFTTYGNNDSDSYAQSQYGEFRFVFGTHSTATTPRFGLKIYNIFGFGGVGQAVPSYMAKNGHVYTYDQDFNVEFPGTVKAQGFIGPINATYDGSGNTITSTYLSNVRVDDDGTLKKKYGEGDEQDVNIKSFKVGDATLKFNSDTKSLDFTF